MSASTLLEFEGASLRDSESAVERGRVHAACKWLLALATSQVVAYYSVDCDNDHDDQAESSDGALDDIRNAASEKIQRAPWPSRANNHRVGVRE